MKYFRKPDGEVYGYDPETQADYIAAAIADGWDDITGQWPPQPDAAALLAARHAQINAERDRRMRGTFAFNGSRFDIDQGSLQRITGAATLAGFSIGQGAPAGFMRWHGGDADFGWITADNQFVAMDAPTVFAFGQAAANHESAHIFAARNLKDMDPIPDDITDDVWWP